MSTTPIKERTLKNIFYSLLSFIWPILIAFLVTPIIVNYFGVKEYGVYIFINTLVSLVGLLDFGVSVALSKFIAERHGSGDEEGVKNLFKTTNSILVIIGVTGAVTTVSSIFLGLTLFPHEIIFGYKTYVPAFIYAGILFFINNIGGLYALIPIAYQRFDISSKIGMTLIAVQQVAILIVVFFNWSLNTLFLLQTLIAFMFYFVYKKYALTILNTHERAYIGRYGWDKQEAVKCYKFGIASFLNNLAGSSLTYLDRIIIPLFLGPSNLTYYSLPGSITNKIPNLSTTLSSVIFPMTAYFEGKGDRGMIKNLYIRSMRLITVVSTAVTVTFIAFAYQLLRYWIDSDLANKATGVLVILSMTNFVLAITYPLNNFLLGMGKLKALSVTSIVTAIINVILLFLLLPRFGIIGAAWAYLLALAPYLFLIYKTEKHYLGLTLRRAHYLKLFRHLSVTSAIVFLVDIYFIKPLVTNFFLVLVASIFSGILFMFIHYLFGFFEKEDSRDIFNFIKHVIKNI